MPTTNTLLDRLETGVDSTPVFNFRPSNLDRLELQSQSSAGRSITELREIACVDLRPLQELYDNFCDDGAKKGIDLIKGTKEDNIYLYKTLKDSKEVLENLPKSVLKNKDFDFCSEKIRELLTNLEAIPKLHEAYEKDMAEIAEQYTGRKQAMSEVAAGERKSEAFKELSEKIHTNYSELHPRLKAFLSKATDEIRSAEKALSGR